jgi:hypothetical protein
MMMRFLDVVKCTALNSIIIINFVETFIPNCRFKNVFSAYFDMEISQQNFYMVFKELIDYTFQFLIETVFHAINFILC